MVAEAERCTGNTLVRRSSTSRELQPHEWRLGGERLPSKTELIEMALRRWYPNAVGRVYYGQVSRPAHMDPLVAHAFVDQSLAVASSENAVGNAISALGLWGSAWFYLLSYLGLRDSVFDEWRRRSVAVARADGSGEAPPPSRPPAPTTAPTSAGPVTAPVPVVTAGTPAPTSAPAPAPAERAGT
jgi:hypothetical protein